MHLIAGGIAAGAIGMIVGFIAAQTVDESVRTKIEAELASLPQSATSLGEVSTAEST